MATIPFALLAALRMKGETVEELIATDGTRRALAAAGVEATAVSDVTGLPEMLAGRLELGL